MSLNELWQIHVMVFQIMTLSSDDTRYQHFRGPCCLHLQGEVGRLVNEHRCRVGSTEGI
jgi:hypothetical protein